MIDPPHHHAACVDAWLVRAAEGRTPEAEVDAFADALARVCTRTRITLGDVTLGAIVERVLGNAGERYPSFASLRFEPSAGIVCAELRAAQSNASARDERLAGMRYVLVELLSILGNLTAEILTPALHAELSKVATAAAEIEPEDESA